MRLFEAWPLLTFSAFRMGSYWRWALIRGWALIRINTVHFSVERFFFACHTFGNSVKEVKMVITLLI